MYTETHHRLFILEPGKNQIFSCDLNGGDKQVVRSNLDRIPDGIFIDKANEMIYFTQMGEVNMRDETAYKNDGSIWRMKCDGSDFTCLVQPGGTRTPKQITADLKNGKLYWSDREGMRVMRCNLDGSEVETLIQTGNIPDDEKDQSNWCVGIAVDPKNRKVYWTQKGDSDAGTGKLCCAGLDTPVNETPANRSDIKTLFDNLPEPIDLELELSHGYLYWTDRGNLPGGNSVCRASIDNDGMIAHEYQVLVEGTGETIGAAFDHDSGNMFITTIKGELLRARIDGGKPEQIGKFSILTGIAIF